MPEKILSQIPREAGFYVNDLCPDHQLYIVVVDLGAGTANHAAQVTLWTTMNFDSYCRTDSSMKKAIIGARVYNCLKSLAGSVTVDDLDG